MNHNRHLLETPSSDFEVVLLQRADTFSNFWGDLSDKGYYKRSYDYFDIINYKSCEYFMYNIFGIV